MKAKDLREKNDAELKALVEELHKDLMNIRIQTVTGNVEDVRVSRKKRRDVARIKTVLRERELSGAVQGSEAK